ncbi:MAG: ketopantoate reductase family protein [Candidatus Hodarchaeota archaeon]
MLKNESDQFTIFGAGSIGLLFAAKLALAGNKVTVIARETHVRQIVAKGLGLQTFTGESLNIPLEAKTQLDKSTPLDQIIISTKAYDNETACNAIKNILNPKKTQRVKLILLQNGVGNEKPYEQFFPQQNIYRLLTTEAALLENPGQVVHTGEGQTILVRRDSGSGSYETHLSKMLTSSGLPCQVSTDFEKSIWTKLLINIPINPLGAIYRVNNGQLLQRKEILRRFEKLVNESITVLAAKSIKTTFKNPLEEIKEVVKKTANNKCSMLRDLEQGKLTEIDYINGAIIALARELGIQVEENTRVVRQVKALEQLKII